MLYTYPEHVVFVLPEHNPDQPAKTEPVFGTAVSLTYVPYAYGPAGLAVTVPEPVPAYLIVMVYFVVVPDDAADWDTVKVFPATVNDAVRAEPVLAATLYDIVPLPVPVDPDEIVIQETPVDVLHEQPLPAVTDMLPVPPLDVKEALDGEIAYVHEVPPPAVTSFEWSLSMPDES